MTCPKCSAAVPDGAAFCPRCGRALSVKRRRRTRGNGTGSVYKLPSGSWCACVTVGYVQRPDGLPPLRKSKKKSGFPTKKAALEYLPKLREEPSSAPASLTLRELYDLWEPTHTTGPNALRSYRAAFRYFAPLHDTPVPAITVDALQSCLDMCQRGKGTKEHMKTVLGLLYKYAVPRGLAQTNLSQYVSPRGGQSWGKSGLPLDVVERLRLACGSVPYADYVYCQCYMGFRPSEFLALDARSYDRQEHAFRGGSKTEAGRDRLVTVSPKIQPIIDRLVADKISGPIFCAPDGSRLPYPQYLKLFYAVLDALGVENPLIDKNGSQCRTYTPHSCRHTFATLMKNVQASDKDKLELIGHTNTAMLRHYQDVSVEDLRRITDAL